jgi:signal transduction histidine kinase
LLGRITTLSQESVAAIKEIIWAIDPKPETVHTLLLKLRDTMIPLCRARNIHLDFPDPGERTLPSQNLLPEQRKHLWLLIKEAVTNATRHAGCTTLSVAYEYSAGQLRIAIVDNGSGFDPLRTPPGRGLDTMKARAARLAGTLDLHSSPGEGTTVKVAIHL